MASAPQRFATSRILVTLRYDSRAGAGPKKYASSALPTCRAARSTSEKTATEAMPISRHARMTRTAISPRFAMSTLLNMAETLIVEQLLPASHQLLHRQQLLVGGRRGRPRRPPTPPAVRFRNGRFLSSVSGSSFVSLTIRLLVSGHLPSPRDFRPRPLRP